MRLSSEQKRVLELSKRLLPLDEEIAQNWANCIDGEWDAHHCDMLTFSQAVEEYQVLRQVDVEIEPTPYPDYKLTKKQLLQWQKHEEDYEWLADEYFDGDMNKVFFDHEEKEVMQRWINLNTGQITILGKVYARNPKLFSFNRWSRWRVVNAKHSGHATKTFWNNYKKHYGSGFYFDITVHKQLAKYGYHGLDAMNWSVEVGSNMEENRSNEAKYFFNISDKEGWENYLLYTVRGQNPDEKVFKLMGYDDFFRYYRLDDDIKGKYLTAYKIAARHNYEPRHTDLWHDMVVNLIQLDRDIHNPHYVCPEDLVAAHQLYLHQHDIQIAKIELQKKMKKAIEENEKYIALCSKFLDIVLQKDDIIIRPLQSVQEFVIEGSLMHNCVYSMGYWKKSNTLILSAQNAKQEHLATIELNTHDWKIKQLYAACNQTCKRHDEIQQIIYDNINVFKRAARRKAA